MKPRTGILALSLLVLCLATSLPAGAQRARSSKAADTTQKQQSSSLPQEVLASVDKGDYDGAKRGLISYLKNRSISPNDTASLQAAMLLEFIRETGVSVLMSYAAESPAKRKFLSEFARDAEWQELYLGAGLVPHQTPIGIDVMRRIWENDKGQVRNKKLATALASVWGGGETAPEPALLKRNPKDNNPVWRYNFFQKRAEAGELHANYKNLRPWELRFTVGIPAQDWDDQSFAWCADHINMPPDRYGWSCWAATYTDPSKFGDNVQGGLYGMPYASESAAQSTHINGGVCGAMSHLGCFAAMAHGIPSYTVGQPGHCAYGFRPERGNWIGGFGGPDGDLHNHIFGGKAPTSYLLMESVFADDATIDKAYRQSFCARALEATGDKTAAEKMWQETLTTSPLHPFFRTQLHRLMSLRGADKEETFNYLHNTIPAYKGNGMAAVDMMKDLSDTVAGMSDEQKLTLYDDLHSVISTTPSSWATNIADTFIQQSASLSSDEAREQYMSKVFTHHMGSGNGTVLGKALEWAVKEYVEKGKVETFSRAFVKAAATSSPAEGNAEEFKKAMRSCYGKAIIAAEQARSIPAFQMLSKAAVKALGSDSANIDLTTTGEMRGKLAPATGMFRISTTSQYDNPHAHRDILTPTGGKCHTDSEKTPNFVVELKDSGIITGCIIRKSDGSEGRMRKATVYTSEDGATWMQKAQTEDMPKEWAVKFPAGTKGKWVKLEFDNSPGSNFAHISHFNVYVK